MLLLKPTEGPRPKPKSLCFHFLFKPLDEAHVLLFILCEGAWSAWCRHPGRKEDPRSVVLLCLSQQGRQRWDHTVCKIQRVDSWSARDCACPEKLMPHPRRPRLTVNSSCWFQEEGLIFLGLTGPRNVFAFANDHCSCHVPSRTRKLFPGETVPQLFGLGTPLHSQPSENPSNLLWM